MPALHGAALFGAALALVPARGLNALSPGPRARAETVNPTPNIQFQFRRPEKVQSGDLVAASKSPENARTIDSCHVDRLPAHHYAPGPSEKEGPQDAGQDQHVVAERKAFVEGLCSLTPSQNNRFQRELLALAQNADYEAVHQHLHSPATSGLNIFSAALALRKEADLVLKTTTPLLQGDVIKARRTLLSSSMLAGIVIGRDCYVSAPNMQAWNVETLCALLDPDGLQVSLREYEPAIREVSNLRRGILGSGATELMRRTDMARQRASTEEKALLTVLASLQLRTAGQVWVDLQQRGKSEDFDGVLRYIGSLSADDTRTVAEGAVALWRKARPPASEADARPMRLAASLLVVLALSREAFNEKTEHILHEIREIVPTHGVPASLLGLRQLLEEVAAFSSKAQSCELARRLLDWPPLGSEQPATSTLTAQSQQSAAAGIAEDPAVTAARNRLSKFEPQDQLRCLQHAWNNGWANWVELHPQTVRHPWTKLQFSVQESWRTQSLERITGNAGIQGIMGPDGYVMASVRLMPEQVAALAPILQEHLDLAIVYKGNTHVDYLPGVALPEGHFTALVRADGLFFELESLANSPSAQRHHVPDLAQFLQSLPGGALLAMRGDPAHPLAMYLRLLSDERASRACEALGMVLQGPQPIIALAEYVARRPMGAIDELDAYEAANFLAPLLSPGQQVRVELPAGAFAQHVRPDAIIGWLDTLNTPEAVLWTAAHPLVMAVERDATGVWQAVSMEYPGGMPQEMIQPLSQVLLDQEPLLNQARTAQERLQRATYVQALIIDVNDGPPTMSNGPAAKRRRSDEPITVSLSQAQSPAVLSLDQLLSTRPFQALSRHGSNVRELASRALNLQSNSPERVSLALEIWQAVTWASERGFATATGELTALLLLLRMLPPHMTTDQLGQLMPRWPASLGPELREACVRLWLPYYDLVDLGLRAAAQWVVHHLPS